MKNVPVSVKFTFILRYTLISLEKIIKLVSEFNYAIISNYFYQCKGDMEYQNLILR